MGKGTQTPTIQYMMGVRLRASVLCVLLVLIPLRGWAVAFMAGDGWPAVSHDHALQMSAPCHGSHGTPQASQPEPMQAGFDATETAASVGALCTDCDLCHASMVFMAGPLVAPSPVSDGPPQPILLSIGNSNALFKPTGRGVNPTGKPDSAA
jgi:hypothetical protein